MQFGAIEDTSNHLVAVDARQYANCRYDVLWRVTAALPTTPSWQTQRGMHAPFPVDKEHDLARLFVDVNDDLADESPQQTFPGTLVRLRVFPQALQIRRKI